MKTNKTLPLAAALSSALLALGGLSACSGPAAPPAGNGTAPASTAPANPCAPKPKAANPCAPARPAANPCAPSRPAANPCAPRRPR